MLIGIKRIWYYIIIEFFKWNFVWFNMVKDFYVVVVVFLIVFNVKGFEWEFDVLEIVWNCYILFIMNFVRVEIIIFWCWVFYSFWIVIKMKIVRIFCWGENVLVCDMVCFRVLLLFVLKWVFVKNKIFFKKCFVLYFIWILLYFWYLNSFVLRFFLKLS